MRSGTLLRLCGALALATIGVHALGAATATVEVLHSFDDGAQPYGALVQGSDGDFYGTTYAGGASGRGTIFRITPAGALTTIFSFDSANGRGPIAGLSLGTDGNFYGATEGGGTNDRGTAFRLTQSGALTTLFNFDDINGAFPRAAPLLASDGKIYGVAGQGGALGFGTVYRINSPGSLTTLFSFDVTRGQNPHGALIAGSDGNFYGTTEQGGSSGGHGTVFKISPSGTLVSLSSFDGAGRGANLQAALLLAGDGNFYGTAQSGGASDAGAVFKMTSAGVVTNLASFGNAHGSGPRSALVAGSDGNFYGTTSDTIFRITPSGTLTTLYHFSGVAGGSPQSGLARGADGNFYGTTRDGGAAGKGTVFRMLAPPGPPSGLSATSGAREVTLSWSPSTTAATYNVYQGTSAGGQATTPAQSGIDTTTPKITGLTNGTYFFTVTSVSSNGESSASNEASATVNVPDDYSFTSVTDALAGTTQQSNIVTIGGLLADSTVPVTVSGDAGAAYSLDGGRFTTSAGTVGNGTTLRLQVNAAAVDNATALATVNTGRLSRTFNVTTAEPDTVPESFAFTPAAGADPQALQVSNSVLVGGINAPAPISVSGAGSAAYSINGSAFTASSGTIRSGSTVRVRLVAPSTFDTTASAVLDIGSVTGNYEVTTKADDVPDPFGFDPIVNAALGSAQVSNVISVSGIAVQTPIAVDGDPGAAYSVNGDPFTTTSGTVVDGDAIRVRVSASSAVGMTTRATLTIGGGVGTFAVTTEAPADGGGGALDLLALVGLLVLCGRRRAPRSRT